MADSILNTLIDIVIWNNSLMHWLLALIVFSATLMALFAIRGVIANRIHHGDPPGKITLRGTFAEMIRRTNVLTLTAVALIVGSWLLDLNAPLRHIGYRILLMILLLQFGLWGNYVLSKLVVQVVSRGDPERVSTSGISVLTILAQFFLWTMLLLVLFHNMDINVTALITGLGIGGVAIGLATQNIISDLFASLSIVLDKPFEKDDFIIVGDLMGTVERIGLKTTRIRSINGEELVFSNNDLLASRIRNYRRIQQRRCLMSIGVTYQTSHEKLAGIPAILKSVVESMEKTEFSRAHFKEYGSFALIFEMVFFVGESDYNLYLDIVEQVNLKIFAAFEKADIEFAYPTQTVHLEGMEK